LSPLESAKQNPNEVLELTKKEENSGNVSTGWMVQSNSPHKPPEGGSSTPIGCSAASN